ncbi:MAG: DNA translocase FtsK [Planctomycetota bacterium]
MSADYNDDVSGPFDGDADQGSYPSDYLDDYVPPGAAEQGGNSSGMEFIGGALFLAGCLPAASVAKALMDGTNLASDGLKGPAALAAGVVQWVGAWPALLTTAAIAVIGALMVLGNLRREPLRRVAGAVVCGLGFAAILSAIHGFPAAGEIGAGGQIGDGTGARLGASLGSWAGVLVGLAVMAGAVWLGFVQADEYDEDDGLGPIVEHDEAPRGSLGSAAAKVAGAAVAGGAAAVAAGSALFRRRPATESDVIGRRADRQRRVSTKKPRRRGAPVTLGDALARGGAEGVSHDEAAMLAPDEKTLAYMEDVWRQASHAVPQPEPIPKSPYPEDVRLKGEIPEGAVPLEPRPTAADEAEASPPTPVPTAHSGAVAFNAPPAASAAPIPAPIPAPVDPDVAPFDFEDELSAPKPLSQAPPVNPAPKATPADPFGTEIQAPDLSPEEAEAYTASSTGLTQGVRIEGPSELPTGVSPYVPKAPIADEVPVAGEVSVADLPESVQAFDVPMAPASPENVDALSKQALQAGAMPASVSPPPRPAWEVGYDDEDEASIEMDAESIPEVDETGRWERRESFAEELTAGSEEGVQESAEDDGLSLSALDELLAEADLATSDVATEDATEEAVEEASATVAEIAEDPVVALDVEDEPDPEEVDEYEEEIAEAEFEDDVEEAEAEPEDESDHEGDHEGEDDVEEAELEEGEELEYEYVDEDGNPIDPSELSDEYELVDVEEDEEAEEDEEDAEYEDEEADEEAAEYEEYEDEEEYEEDEDEEAAELEEGEVEAELEEEEDDEYEVAEAEVEDEEPEEAELEDESGAIEDHVLEPQPRPAPEGAVEDEAVAAASDEGLSADGIRILEAGRLVVTKDRAAVSVIQKGFDVEFAEACSILEELHAQGLIGPYQEGKKRAILMSLEEWEGRFAHS